MNRSRHHHKAIAPYLRERKPFKQLTLAEILTAAGNLNSFTSARELYLHLVETQGRLIGQMVGTPTLGQGVPSGTLRQWANRFFTEGPVIMQKAADTSRTNARRLKRSLLERLPTLAPPQPRGLPGRRFRRVREEEEPMDLYETTTAPEVFEDEIEEVSERHPRLPRLPSRRMHLRRVSRALGRQRHAFAPTVLTPYAEKALNALLEEGYDPTDEDVLFEAVYGFLPDNSEWINICVELDTMVKDLFRYGSENNEVENAIEMYLHGLIMEEVKALDAEQETGEEFEGI